MPIIKVETPDGIVDVEVEGEEPNQEEQQAIMNTFFSEKADVGAINQKAGINFATASGEELEEYIKAKEALGVDAATGEEIERDPTEEVGVDYVSGLRNFRVRAGLANKETTEERAAYLKNQVGIDGFRLDEKGRFILTKVGRQKLNMPDGPEIAIDEKGLSRYDLADFIGQSGVPLTVGIGASILTGGIGTIPAMLTVGASMGVGKLLDEAFESAQGYQRESAGQIAKAAAVEAVFGAAGEGVGRFVSGALGRLFKGSASRQAEEAKEGGRELLKQGFRPTVEGGAPGTFGILTRLQAIYEGISPNQAAAEKNVKALMAELKRVSQVELGGVGDDAIEKLGKVIKKDVEKIYADNNTLLKNAEKVKNQEVEREVRKLIKPLEAGENLGLKEVKGLLTSKALFSEAIDDLYTRADSLLGPKRQDIIPVANLRKAIDDALIDANPKVEREIRNSKAMDILRKAEERAKERLIKSRGGSLGSLGKDDINRELFISPSEGNRIRSMLAEMEYTGVPGVNFSKLREAIDEGFTDGRGILERVIRTIKGQQQEPVSPNMLGQLGIDEITADFGGGLANVDDLLKGLDILRDTQTIYAQGFSRLNQPIVKLLMNATKKGKITKDDQLLAHVINKADAEDLKGFFLARKGVPVNLIKELGLDQKPIMVRYGTDDLTLEEAEALYASLPKGNKEEINQTKVLFEQILKARNVKAGREDAMSRASGLQGEDLRERLASSYLSSLLKNKRKVTNTIGGKRVFDGIKIANAIDDLGDKKSILFGKDTKALDDLTSLLRASGKEIDEEVINSMPFSNLSQAIRGVKEASERIDAVNKNEYLSALQNGEARKIADTIFNKQDASMVRAFMKNDIEVDVPGQNRTIKVTPFDDATHKELVDGVQDAAMSRILRSLGDVEDDQFATRFLSGSLGPKLRGSLDNYGRDTLNAMFGKQKTDELYKLSEIMIRASDQPLKGKGGLAAPSIALGLSIFGLMTAPLATIGAIAFYKGMSTALRTPAVMNVLLSSRRPGEDAIGQALQTMNTISAQLGTQTVVRPSIEQTQRATAAISTALPQQEQTNTAIPNVAPATAGTAANIDPTNPIVNPNPVDQALAQRLAGTSAISPRPPS
jgi:hypothetical protein